MADYQLGMYGGVVRRRDGAQIPEDLSNSDWQGYLAWVAAGNTPDPADPLPLPDPQWVADGNALTAFIAAYPDMLARLDTIQTEMDAIKSHADALAGMSNWTLLTAAQVASRLQQVMPVLGQDLSTLAAEFKAVTIGLENQLHALAVLRRRAGGN